MQQVQLPYAVKVFAPQSSSTNRLVYRYFETQEEAAKLSQYVEYRPGEAFKYA